MKSIKKFLIIILFIIPIFASEVATKDDIKLLVNLIKENNRQMDKRFDDVNKRFEDMNSKFNMIVTIMLIGFTLIMGYLIKERNSIKRDVKDEIDKELELKLTQKADINLVERVVNVLKKHNFIVK